MMVACHMLTTYQVDQDPNTGASFLNGLTVNEDDDVNDPDLTDLTQGQGKLFHFYDFSIFGVTNTNFWENRNEFYPNTDDYEMIDANNPGVIVEDLKSSNVRHHHMPCNTNSGREVISDNTSQFTAAQDSTTTIRYFAFGDDSLPTNNQVTYADNTQGGGNTLNNLGLASITSDLLTNSGVAGYDNAIDDLENSYGNTSNWVYTPPSANMVGQVSGWFVAVNKTGWTLPNISWSAGADITAVAAAGTGIGGFADAEVEIDQNGNWITGGNNPGSGPINSNPGRIDYGIFVWQDVQPAITQNGYLAHEVRALGIRLQDIKIPKTIVDKVQGFRIYYAERKHENRRVLGQDILKRCNEVDDWDISGCSGAGSNGSSESFILSSGSLYKGIVNTTTFHDFYLLNNKHSLVPATHTSIEYRVNLLSFTGPLDLYSEVSPAPDFDEDDCLRQDSYSALHFGFSYFNNTSNALPFQHFPLREKCKSYINGDSIYDGRGIGFGKRIYNIGGESSILLAYKPNRTPDYDSANAVGWLPAGGGAPWHADNPGTDFSYGSHTEPRVELHNLNAFKTDMYLSYDTQELVWTGFEVLGVDNLANYTVEDNNVSTPGATHNTGDIFGGDTFICRHGYRTTHRPEVQGTAPKDHKSIYYVICESTDNINFRHETDKDSSYFPGSPARKVLALEANIDLTKKDNMKYDESFSLGIADIKPAIPYPLRESDPSIFKTRVQRSAKADNSSLIDNYRVHLALQFKDLPRNRGDLWKLISLNNLLYLHTTDSLFRTKGKQSLQMSDGTESFVGSGDIFTQDPDEVIQTKFGYGGTQSQWVCMVTKHGYFTMDYRNRRVFMFKDQLYDIGKTGLESWFQDNIPFALEQYGLDTSYFDNPIIGIGFHAMYDERYDRVILTKRDLKPTKTFIEQYNLGNITYDSSIHRFRQGGIIIKFDNFTFFENSGWTVSYDVELNVWVSFHDYVPYKYTRSADKLASFTEGSTGIWVHNDELNRGKFYGTDYASEFEFIYNSGKNLDKTFYSFEYMIDVYSTTNVLIHDQGFSSFYVYNTHQISGELDIEYMINTRRIGNAWKINKFRDMADLVNTPVAAGAGSNFGVPGASVAGTNITSTLTSSTGQSMFTFDGMTETINGVFINAAKSWDRQRKFTDKWVGIRLKYDNITKKLINLYSTEVAAKKFYR